MPANSPALTPRTAEVIAAMGERVRQHRKRLRISATACAEAAGLSRVTLHRIEKGEPSVTMGAYMAVFGALGLTARVAPAAENMPATKPGRQGWIPARVRIANYPQLQALAWQVHGTPELTPREALDIYERNWRHVDAATLTQDEKDLVEALRLALGSDERV